MGAREVKKTEKTFIVTVRSGNLDWSEMEAHGWLAKIIKLGRRKKSHIEFGPGELKVEEIHSHIIEVDE
jgi:hypothetical protein